MKFGKLEDIREVDFRLPSDPAGTKACLRNANIPDSTRKMLVGCTGWSMPAWKGRVYPKGTQPKDFLREYGRQFNTIELNSTHYHIPPPDRVRTWFEATPDDFRFCPKLPQEMSHRQDLGLEGIGIGQFTDAVSGFGHKLGHCFLQLPPHFGPEGLPLLLRFLESWPQEVPLALECRHPEWFDGSVAFESLCRNLEAWNMPLVITDVAGRRDVLHMRLTCPVAMIRFVGNDLDHTDFERLDDWAIRLAAWFENGLEKAYFFTHEPDNINAPQAAAYLVDKFSLREDIDVRGPVLPKRDEDQQMTLF